MNKNKNINIDRDKEGYGMIIVWEVKDIRFKSAIIGKLSKTRR